MSVLEHMLTPAMKLADAGRAKIDARTTETLTHPQARAYADLYFARVDSGKPLARADFPSRPLLPFMPHICLFEPIDEGADWRLRLVGTAICRRYGVDATGFTVSQLYPPEVAQKQIAGYRETAATRAFAAEARLLRPAERRRVARSSPSGRRRRDRARRLARPALTRTDSLGRRTQPPRGAVL